MIERVAVAQTEAAPSALPRHVAIIMDGNRRWALERGLPPLDGHRAGAVALRRITEAAARIGIEILTVYGFSQENWRRPAAEVGLLMELVGSFAASETRALRAQNVRVRAIGRTSALPAATKAAVDALSRATAANDGMLLNLALNYGARAELCDAIKALAVDVRRGSLALDDIGDESIAGYLYTAGLPDPDLVIRTGGELRVSNFLLYQIAYAELWSTPVAWPAFERHHFERALEDFASRQRRFGS